ncbi:MnhB domain-containing protein [Haloplanus rubicundus]|uniref:Cation:proton antiporter n=1 Tax=Haloplanus rubicundus TaxID=1547898 RepID=A0A345EE16_9EURY|nr:MnhB domain-containing protein [Haloplanus rubicundus]AXG10438.1 cation:proton antiporter [Haloplanus rubicundus]
MSDADADPDAAADIDDEVDGEGTLSRPASERPPYVESTIIMTTVRVIAPFVLTLGAFVMLHGASSAGGGFQGGVIAATTVVMLGFAFGIEPIAAHLRNEQLALLVLSGVGTFLVVGFGGYLVGGNFLQVSGYETLFHNGSKYSIELVEVGIGVVVSGVITGLFFLLGTGVDTGAEETDTDTEPEADR